MKLLFAEPDVGTGGLDAAISPLREGLQNAGVELTVVRKDSGSALENVDVAHFHGLWHPWHSRLAAECRRRKIPYVVSPHGMLEPWAWRYKRWKKWPYFRLIERRYLSRAARLFATSAMEKNNLKNLLPEANVVDIPLGLTGNARPNHEAARRVLGWDGRPVLLYLSRLHEKKGLHLLLEALAQCPLAKSARLCVVGGGDAEYVGRLRALEKQHAVNLPEIEWVGEVWGEARWKYFQAADLFCLPSFSENFGLAVLEALQVGTRALASNATPWRDFLRPGAGWIVEPRVPSIVEAVNAFLGSPDFPDAERQRLGDWAWERFSWETLVPQYYRAYSEASAKGAV